MLDRETCVGPWADLPVAWRSDDRFDEGTYRMDVARCCNAGMPGVYTAGTTGDFYAMEFDEWKAVNQATVEECHSCGKPAMVDCTSTYNLGAARRAAYAAEIGDEQIVPFFKEVSDASGGQPLSIYDTMRARKVLTLDQHRAIRESVPNYLMVKVIKGTAGCRPESCRALSKFVNVFVGEEHFGELGRAGAKVACSSLVYWNPPLILSLWQHFEQADWAHVDAACMQLKLLFEFFDSPQGFALRGFTDSAGDRLGAAAGGFLKCSLRVRGPCPAALPDDVKKLRQWYREHCPEMLIA